MTTENQTHDNVVQLDKTNQYINHLITVLS